MAYQLNRAALDLIKDFEGWHSKAYKDPVGVWTIGYGHTSKAGPPKVVAGLQISKANGEAMLQRDMQQYAKAVDDAVNVPLNANQFGALVSFCYNVGAGNFRKSSVLKRVNARRFHEVPGRLMLWNKAGGRILKGLTRRRDAEGALFITPVAEKEIPAEPKPLTVPREKVAEALKEQSRTIKNADQIKKDGFWDKLFGTGGIVGLVGGWLADIPKDVVIVVVALIFAWGIWRQIRKDRAADRIIEARVDDAMTGKHIGRPEATLQAAVGAVNDGA